MYRELERGDHVQVFIAELDGVPAAAAAELFTSRGGVLKSRLAGMHRADLVKKSGASAAVEVIVGDNSFSGPGERAVMFTDGSTDVTVVGNTVRGHMRSFEIDRQSEPGFQESGNSR
ncbi:MAG: hypothetical protein M3Y48_20020 [Actinomycetota bacterium]|nr:hypothetical protein [Actinomycetota bacterium]MDQ2883382.1 hypothetical protein [Actinomycetota bacterium]PZS11807.1 MAG: hypothetical protein DLM60_23705 [Pseudonocardiales bacterium]